MKRSITIAVFAAAVVGAFALGTRQGGPASAPTVSERDARPSLALPTIRVASTTVEGAPALSAAEIRSIIREEVAGSRDATPPPDERDPELADARDQAFARAQQLIDCAGNDGTWTEADRDTLRVALGSIDREQSEQIFSELYPALNEGRIRLAYAGSPL